MRPQPLFWSWLRPERKCVYDSKGISYFAKNRKCKTHFYTFFTHFYTCVSGFFLGLHMCKWIFFTYSFLHILTHPYTFRYIVVFLVHAFVQWHHMIWNQTELEWHVARLWSSVDVLSCGPLGSNSLIFIFSKLRLSNPKFKNIIKFSSAAKKFEENLRNKGFYNTKNKNAKRNDEEKNC